MNVRYIAEYHQLIGPQTDIPAPDINTDADVMAWMRDEYERIAGEHVPGVITGKPPALNGSEGRESATSYGGAVLFEQFVTAEGLEDDVTVAIQGFGNVGSHLAVFLYERGYDVVAVSSAQGGLYDSDGLDIPELVDGYENETDLFETDAEEITNETLLTLDVDVLIPAAIEDQITSENAAEVQAEAVLEMANGPTTPQADEHLTERGIPALPDILANAGGVTVSYFEWVQNDSNEYWSKTRVQEKLATQMQVAFENVASTKAEGKDRTWRQAAYTNAVDSVLEAERYRGNIDR